MNNDWAWINITISCCIPAVLYLQESGPNIALMHSIKYRRDVVFSQAVSSCTTVVYHLDYLSLSVKTLCIKPFRITDSQVTECFVTLFIQFHKYCFMFTVRKCKIACNRSINYTFSLLVEFFMCSFVLKVLRIFCLYIW